MHNDIITQNIKLIDEKLIINEKKFEIINGIKYLVFYVSREFEPKICDRYGMMSFKKGDNKKRLYQKNKNKKGG